MQFKTTKLLFLLFTAISITASAQDAISRSWTSFTQTMDVQAEKEVNFKLTGKSKVITDDPEGVARTKTGILWKRLFKMPLLN